MWRARGGGHGAQDVIFDAQAEFAKMARDGIEHLQSKKMTALEAAITAAVAEVKAAAAALQATARAMASAESSATAAGAGKNPKPEIVAEAQRVLSEASEANKAASAEHQAASTRLRMAQVNLRREHVRAVAAVLVEDGHSARRAFKDLLPETKQALTQAYEQEAQHQTAKEAARQDARFAREEEAADLQTLRTRVDPRHEADRKRCIEKFGDYGFIQPKDWDPNIAIGGRPFAPPPPVSTFKYPVHTATPPRGQRLNRIARFKGGDKATMADGLGRRKAVQVNAVELADKALRPKPVSLDLETGDHRPEAVYLVQDDSTSTAWARAKPVWVNERQLRPRPLGKAGLADLRSGPHPWERIWPQNISFEQARAHGLREAEKLVERERALQSILSARGMARPQTASTGPTPPQSAGHHTRHLRPASARTHRPAASLPTSRVRPQSAKPTSQGARPNTAAVGVA